MPPDIILDDNFITLNGTVVVKNASSFSADAINCQGLDCTNLGTGTLTAESVTVGGVPLTSPVGTTYTQLKITSSEISLVPFVLVQGPTMPGLPPGVPPPSFPQPQGMPLNLLATIRALQGTIQQLEARVSSLEQRTH